MRRGGIVVVGWGWWGVMRRGGRGRGVIEWNRSGGMGVVVF